MRRNCLQQSTPRSRRSESGARRGGWKALSVLLAALLALTLHAVPAAAQSAVVKGKKSEARLIVDRATVSPGETLWVGLHISVPPGWHTYWRSAGDVGPITTITWKLPPGFQAGAIQWPVPTRIPTGDFVSFAYEREVTLLIPIEVTASPGRVTLAADATWASCADQCYLEDGHFELPIVVGSVSAVPTPDAPLIEKTRAGIPQPATFPVSASRGASELSLTAGPGLPADVTGALLFPDGDGTAILNAAPQQVSLTGDALSLRVPLGKNPPQRLAGLLVLQSAQGSTGFEIATDVAAIAGGGGDTTFWVAFLSAILGGLILNVMPCVLPVLVMKTLGMLARHESPAVMRRDAVIYTAGVITAFTVLVAVLLGLRGAGAALGWGFQLQNPIVVAVLANIMLAMGLSLSGVFAVGGSFAGVGQSLTAHAGGWGSFFTGVLAVVVGAPCGAPFMGVAVGFALTQSPAVAIAVFEGLALGLALPYLAIAFVPALARRLPKPGVWMERLKQLLAFPLYASAAWMLWVVTQQVAADGLVLVLVSLVAVGFAAWSYGLAPTTPHPRRWLVAAVIGIVVAGATIASLRAPAEAKASSTEAGAYTPAKVAALRAEGKPVLVNFTAAWCLTCLMNERVALSQPEVKAAIESNGVTYLKADWTNRDADITAALHDLGRDTVPVYALYPAKGAPQLLPQVLTPGVVIDALSKVSSAGGGKPAS